MSRLFDETSLGSSDGKFFNPAGLAVDSADNIYVVDQNNSRVQEFDSNGNFLLKWGTFGSGDGQFNDPLAVAVKDNGEVEYR